MSTVETSEEFSNTSTSSAICGVVVRVRVLLPDRRVISDKEEKQNEEFCRLCTKRFTEEHGKVIDAFKSEVIAIFKPNQALQAVECLENLRNKLLEMQVKEHWKISMRAGLSEGDIYIENKNEIAGEAFDDTLFLSEHAHPMQIMFEQSIHDAIEKNYQFVERRPAVIGGKRSPVYYLHRRRERSETK